MNSPALSKDRGDAPGIRLRGVRKEFGPVVAVDHLDLDVADGELFAALGAGGRV